MADHYLGEDNYYLNTGQLICIGPGETQQLLHRDELNWPQAAGQTNELTVTAIFALTDFTEENGATVIAPGSHRWPGALPEVNPKSTCRATMKAGSALLYNGKVIHGGRPNGSTETAQRLPRHAQKMLGFRSYAPPKSARLGMVNYEDASSLFD